MPDKRKHRGPHPEDQRLFSPQMRPALDNATEHLSWLLSHGYVMTSALKLVGDRFGLDARQRLAVQRSACSDEQCARRADHQVSQTELSGCQLDVDGFNLLTTIEAALAGGVLLRGRDGCLRDMASMHGSYRKVEETIPALLAIGRSLDSLRVASCTWWLDRPVSNSGRISQVIRDVASQHRWAWDTELVPDPDPVLCRSANIVVTADSVILDASQRWFDLASRVVSELTSDAWIIGRGSV